MVFRRATLLALGYPGGVAVDSNGNVGPSASLELSAPVLAVPTDIVVTQSGEEVSVAFVTASPEVVISVGATGFDPESISCIKYKGPATSPVVFRMSSLEALKLKIASRTYTSSTSLLWSEEFPLVPTSKSPISVPINSHTTGTQPLLITTLLIPPGAYSTVVATLGCEKAAPTATLTLETETEVLSTVERTGSPAPSTGDGFTLSIATWVSIKLRCNVPEELAVVIGLTIS